MDFTTKEIAHKIAAAACDKKAKDILLLNMENIYSIYLKFLQWLIILLLPALEIIF